MSYLNESWIQDVLETGEPLSEAKKEAVAVMLHNQREAAKSGKLFEGEATNVTGGVGKWDPILIGMVRRAAPKLVAFDIAGVQPMSGPSGLIFTLRARYNNQSGQEAFVGEADTAFSGAGSQAGSIFGGDDLYNNTTGAAGADGTADGTALSSGTALDTAAGEQLGVDPAVSDFKEMGLSIEKHAISAKTRALKASYTVELEQDLRAVHGLSAEQELINILSQEITQEINREFLRTMYTLAKLGAQNTTVPGLFDVVSDSDGRWAVERFKGLLFQIELERNAIAKETRRGKGNFIVCSSNVGSALAMTGLLDMGESSLGKNLVVDDTGATFAGMLNGMRVYIDPYVTEDFVLVGYAGQSSWDSGLIYAPYIPLTLYKTTSQTSFQPAIAFKTRYAIAKTPMEHGNAEINFATDRRTSPYYRIFKIDNLF